MAGTFAVTPYKPYDFEAANKHYAEHGFPEPDPLPGSRSRAVVVTCTDPRCSPEHFFKLTEQEASVLRVEGGRAADPGIIRTVLLLACQLAPSGNVVKEVLVVHHTDCTALRYSDRSIRDIILANDPNAPGGPWKKGALAWAESIPYLPIPEGQSDRERLERSVREDVRFLQLHPLWKPSILVTGWIYDIETKQAERLNC